MAYATTLRYNPIMHSLSRVSTIWSKELAYVIGLLVTDGCLSKNGRHIDPTSKDREQL